MFGRSLSWRQSLGGIDFEDMLGGAGAVGVEDKKITIKAYNVIVIGDDGPNCNCLFKFN